MKSGIKKGRDTFVVKILNRQNSTWQGNITWVEGEKSQNFRSALEMLKLMDEALEVSTDVEGGQQ
ncbi:MAG: hypothetical protein E7286_11110 [Lachnospiraceae bacterium]|nr:hypothetical protein [Lachnospiraceae bacterium]